MLMHAQTNECMVQQPEGGPKIHDNIDSIDTQSITKYALLTPLYECMYLGTVPYRVIFKICAPKCRNSAFSYACIKLAVLLLALTVKNSSF